MIIQDIENYDPYNEQETVDKSVILNFIRANSGAPNGADDSVKSGLFILLQETASAIEAPAINNLPFISLVF